MTSLYAPVTEVLALLTVLAVGLVPKRWLFYVAVVAANVDVSTNPGINTVKHLVVPAVLVLRTGWRPQIRPTRVGIACATYVLIVAVGVLRSDLPVDAAKFVVYLLDLWLVCTALRRLRQQGRLSQRTLVTGAWLSLAMGVVGIATPGYPGYREPRLTSYVNAQNYAVILVAFLVVIGWNAHRDGRPLPRLVTVALLGGLVASGSRSAAAGLILGALAGLAWSAARSSRASAARRAMILTFAVVAIPLGGLVALRVAPSGRLAQGLQVFSGGTEAVGTFGFRQEVYDEGLRELRAQPLPALMIGEGTSTGGRIVRASTAFGRDRVAEDPNRALHNEFLRAAYEIGLIGLGALLWSLAAVWRATGRNGNRLVAVVAAPLLLLFLASENPLAGGEIGSGFGFALLLAALLTTRVDPEPAGRSLQHLNEVDAS